MVLSMGSPHHVVMAACSSAMRTPLWWQGSSKEGMGWQRRVLVVSGTSTWICGARDNKVTWNALKRVNLPLSGAEETSETAQQVQRLRMKPWCLRKALRLRGDFWWLFLQELQDIGWGYRSCISARQVDQTFRKGFNQWAHRSRVRCGRISVAFVGGSWS